MSFLTTVAKELTLFNHTSRAPRRAATRGITAVPGHRGAVSAEKAQKLGETDLSAIVRVYETVARFPKADRDGILERELGDRPDLRAEVETLLAMPEGALDGFLDEPLAGRGLPDVANEPEHRLLPGKMLGPYRIVGEIASGGMGVVYEALDTVLSRTVAIKTILKASLCDPRLIARFKSEARTLAQLREPGIVTIHTMGEENGIHYIVMERLEGENLAEAARRGPFPIDRCLSLMEQLVRALLAAHDAGIIHRDIKPSNVFLCRSGDVKLTDFGIAKSIEGATPDLTSTGIVIGTLNYLAPELLSGAPASVSSDIYAIGILLYELVTGRTPYKSGNRMRSMVNIQTRSLTPPSSLNPAVDGNLEAIMLKLCEKSAARRYRTLREVVRDLDEARRARSVPAAPPPFPTECSASSPAERKSSDGIAAAAPATRWHQLAVLSLFVVCLPAASVLYLAPPRSSSPPVAVTASAPERQAPPPAPAVVPYAPGTYVVWDTDTPIPASALRSAGFTGVTIQVLWSAIEAEEGSYSWASLDARLAEAAAGNLHVALALIADLARTPAWLAADPGSPTVEIVSIHPPAQRLCTSVVVPAFWAPRYHSSKLRFIRAVGERYSSSPRLVAVTASFANYNSEVWWLPAEGPDVLSEKCGLPVDNAQRWIDAGYTAGRAAGIGMDILEVTALAFPRQAIKLPFEPAPDRLRDLATLRSFIHAAYAAFPGRVYAQVNNLDTASPGSDALDPAFSLLAERSPSVGLQMMSEASAADRNGCLQNHGVSPCPARQVAERSLAIALSYKPTFVELFAPDAGAKELEPLFLTMARRLVRR